jgi:uncharacterized membrane protein YdfJ with MMPL/SSD domain
MVASSPSFSPTDVLLRRVYFPFLLKFHWWILGGWVAVFALCVAFGPAFLNQTRSNLDLPAGTPSETAVKAFEDSYPDVSKWAPAFIVQHTDVLPTICNYVTSNFSVALTQFVAEHSSTVERTSGYWEYWVNPLLRPLALQAVSQDNRTLVTTVSFKRDTTIKDIDDFLNALLTFTKGWSSPSVSVAVTGLFPLFLDMSKSTEVNFALIDGIAIPVSVLILGLRVQSYRHMGVAFACVACTILFAFAILNPVSQRFDINPFAPSVLLSLGIAISFDYSLFMLTRFREERIVECRR